MVHENPHTHKKRPHRRGQTTEYLSKEIFSQIAFFLQWRLAFFLADSKHSP